MIHAIEKLFEGPNIRRVGEVLYFAWPMTGTLKSVRLIIPNAGPFIGPWRFDVQSNGVYLFESSNLLIIPSDRDDEKTGLSIAVTKGQNARLVLRTKGSGQMNGPIVLICEVDDGVEGGGGGIEPVGEFTPGNLIRTVNEDGTEIEDSGLASGTIVNGIGESSIGGIAVFGNEEGILVADCGINYTDLVSASSYTTFTNKRWTTRTSDVTSASTVTPNANADEVVDVSALSQATLIEAPTGTPINNQTLFIRILDDGTGRALTWDAIYRPIGVELPATTIADKTLYVGMIYNAISSTWDVLSVNVEE